MDGVEGWGDGMGAGLRRWGFNDTKAAASQLTKNQTAHDHKKITISSFYKRSKGN